MGPLIRLLAYQRAEYRGEPVCNLYSVTKRQQAIVEFTRAVKQKVGNMPPLPAVFPDYAAPIVRNSPEGRELVMARWGIPSPVFALKGRNSDSGVTNVRNVKSPRWRRWLGIEHRCVVPFTSFAENELQPDGRRLRSGSASMRRDRSPSSCARRRKAPRWPRSAARRGSARRRTTTGESSTAG